MQRPPRAPGRRRALDRTWTATKSFLWVALLPTPLLLFLGCGSEPEPSSEPSSRLVVIGVDSLSWSLVDPLLANGELPNLAALRARGSEAEMVPVEPLISPPNWTSLATGRSPEHHGIETFFTSRHQIRVPAVWDRLAAAGLRVGVYDFLLTWPAQPLPDGFVIPGWLRRDDRLWPEDLEQRLGRQPHVYEALDMGGLDATVEEVDRELRHKAENFCELLDLFELDAGFVTFYAVDVISHRFFHTYQPGTFEPAIPYEPRFEDQLPETLRRIDLALGTLVGCLSPRDHVVVVSDHGAKASNPVPRLWGYETDVLLAGAGLDGEGIEVINAFVEAAFKIEEGPNDLRDATATALVEHARSLRTANGKPLFRVRWIEDPVQALPTSEEGPLGPGGVAADVIPPNLPAHSFVFVAVEPGIAKGLWPDGEVVIDGQNHPIHDLLQAHDFSGDHEASAFFLAAGPAIAPSQTRSRLSVVDVAPLLLHLAGQPIPDDLEGRSPERWLDPEHLARSPIQTISADQAPRLPPDLDLVVEDSLDEETRRKLQALGYID